MRTTMNIGIVAWSLFETRGGIERSACHLAQAMIERGHRVTIFHKEVLRRGAEPMYTLPSGAALAGLRLDYDTLNLDAARQQIAMANLDVLIAMFSWESLLWFPSLVKGTGIRLVISEHSNPELVHSKWNAYERHCCMLTADRIHVLVKTYADLFPPILRDRVTVIPNPAYLTDAPPPRPEQKERYTLLGVGRFVELIRTFSLLQQEFPQWDLELCGDGPSFKAYTSLIEELGLKDRVRMPGMVMEIGAHYAGADIFCIPSRVEELCMVGMEAHHYNLPAVGFAACSGVNDIIVHGENGFLAEEMTPESLARHLTPLMRDAALRQSLGERGKAMLVRYAPQKVFNAWEDLLWSTVRDTAPQQIRRIDETIGTTDEDILATQELLRRKHPFDRSHYLQLHEQALRSGVESPFSQRVIEGFMKKHDKFCLPGYTTPASLIRKGLRQVKNGFRSLVPTKEHTRG